MTKTLLLIVMISLCVVHTAEARPKPQKNPFVANKELGVGLTVGVPTGITGKYYTGKQTAFGFAIGSSHKFYTPHGVFFQTDFIWHPAVITQNRSFWLALYLGAGTIVVIPTEDDANSFQLGGRAPVGLLLDFTHRPVDFFLEAAVMSNFDVNIDQPIRLNGAMGVRYYF